jgi:hypothetical protein
MSFISCKAEAEAHSRDERHQDGNEASSVPNPCQISEFERYRLDPRTSFTDNQTLRTCLLFYSLGIPFGI